MVLHKPNIRSHLLGFFKLQISIGKKSDPNVDLKDLLLIYFVFENIDFTVLLGLGIN
jgi:hypothetical protein